MINLPHLDKEWWLIHNIPGGNDNAGEGWIGDGTRVDIETAFSSFVGLGLIGVPLIELPDIFSYGFNEWGFVFIPPTEIIAVDIE